ncbi:MAG: hypothetical protein RIS54_1658 [Verrucomicrobiota bacterium]|jgi:hypothetical protein
MKTIIHPVTAGALALAVLLAGCNTPPANTLPPAPVDTPQMKRSAEQPEAFNELSDEQQAELLKGKIAVGQPPEAVYIALGKPNLVRTTADGKVTLWTYSHYLPPLPPGARDNATKKKPVRVAKQGSDPLTDSMIAWQLNVDRRGTVMTDPDVAPQAEGQSYADYARMLQQRDIASQVPAPIGTRGLISIEERQADVATGRRPYTVLTALMDKEAWQDYHASIAEFPLPLPNMVQLDVVYVDGVVLDAIVNNSTSAFTPPAAPTPTDSTQP